MTLADEVEIGNVGGEGGVASEATLASLTRAIEKLAASTGKDPTKEAGKVQQAHNDAVKSGITVSTKNRDALEKRTEATNNATTATNKYSRALISAAGGVLGSVAGGLKNMGEALLDGKNNLTDFAKHVPLVGSYLGVLTRVIDSNIENFRALSQVGATFGDGLNDIRATAAQAGMPLGEFVELVSQNSESMKLFGADTAAGAKNFAAMSKELRSGPGKALMNLGFASSELNELLIDYAEIQSGQFTRDRQQGRVSAENAAAFGEEMMKLTAVSGKRREQIMAELKQQQGDLRVRVATSRMSEEEAERFRLNIADIAGESTALSNALIDFQDGIPSDNVTRRLQGMSATFDQLGADVGNMNPRELNNFVVGVREDLERYAEANGMTVQELQNSIPGMAEAFGIIGETAKRSEMTPEQYDALVKKQLQEKKNGEALKQFNETINQVLADLTSAFIDSGVLKLVQEEIGNVAAMFQEFVKSDKFKETIKEAAETVRKFIENFKNFDLKTALFGGKRTVTEHGPGGMTYEREIDVEGLLPDDMFSGIEDIIGSALTSAITSPTVLAAVAAIFLAPKLLSAFTSGIGSLFGGSGGSDSTKSPGKALKPSQTAGGKLGGNIGGALGGLAGGLLEGITNALAGAGAKAPLIGLGAAAVGGAIALIGAGIAGATWLVGNALPSFAEGMKSFEDLDGARLKSAAEGMIAMTGAMAAFGAGSVVSGIGNMVGSVAEGIVSFFGGDSPLEKLQKFADADIDSQAIEQNAGAIKLFADAMNAIDNLGTTDLDGFSSAIADLNFDALTAGVTSGIDGMSTASKALDASAITPMLAVLDTINEFSVKMSNLQGLDIFNVDDSIQSIVLAYMGLVDEIYFMRDYKDLNVNQFTRYENVKILQSTLNQMAGLIDDVQTFSTKASTLDITGVENLNENLNSVMSAFSLNGNNNNNFDTAGIDNYVSSIDNLVSTLENLNTVLQENQGLDTPETVAVNGSTTSTAANGATTGSGESINQLNSLMSQVLLVLQEIATDADQIERNTASAGTNLASGRVSVIR